MKKINVLAVFFAVFLLIIVLVYFTITPFRFDFTEDRRYSVSDYSKILMADINEPIYVNFYLNGNLNSSFYKLRKASLDLLHDLSLQTSYSIAVSHIYPLEESSEERRLAVFNRLTEKGLTPTDVYMRDKSGNSIRQTIFPWLELSYKGRSSHVSLLKNLHNTSGEENINISIENLEFEIVGAIMRLMQDDVQRIAFLEGHDELSEAETYQITKSLSHYYHIDRGKLVDDVSVLNDYAVVIVAGPKETFSEAEKYIIDQYIMYGGRVIWLIDGVRMDKNKLAIEGRTPAISLDVNLEDMLYRYGVRVQPVLIQDLQCSYLPVNIAPQHESPQFDLMPWYYGPLLLTAPYHPITKNIGELKSEFVSVIELRDSPLNNQNKVSVLLASSSQSRLIGVPTIISLEDFQHEDDASFYSGYHPVAVLMEGVFSSNYKNRMIPPDVRHAPLFKEESFNTKQLFIAGSSIIRNETNGVASDTTTLALGYDRIMNVSFGNDNFFVNAVNYLAGNTSWLKLRNKEYKIRLLNQHISKEKRTILQVVNIILPLFLILCGALLFPWVRHIRYGKPKTKTT